MAHGHDDDKGRDRDHGGRSSSFGSSHSSPSHSSSSHSSSKGNGKAGSFDSSKLVGDENGVLSSSTLQSLNFLYQTGLPWFRRAFQERGSQYGQKFAEDYLGHAHNSTEAIKFGNRTATTIAMGMIFAKQIYELGDTLYDTTKQMNALRQAAGPLSRAGDDGNGLFTSDADEGLANARAKINRVFGQRMLMTAAGAVSAIPQLFIWHHENKAKFAADKQREEYAALKDKSPEEQAKWFKEQLELKLPMGISGGKAKQVFLEEGYREYKEKFEQFKASNAATIEAELKKEVNFKSKELTPFDEEKRKLYDLPTLLEKEEWMHRQGVYGDKEISPERRESLEKRYEADQKSSKRIWDYNWKRAVDKKIRAEFVRREGAFDKSWEQDLYFGLNSIEKRNIGTVKTHREQLEEQYNSVVKDFNKVHGDEQAGHKDAHKKDDGSGKMLEALAGAAGAVMGDIAMSLVGGKKLDEFKMPQALDRVLHLQRALEKADGNPPDLVPGIKGGKENERDCSYAQYVHKVFQQHQQDSVALGKAGFAEIGERYFEKLERAKWSDDAVQKLNDDELNPYEYAVKHIAKRLKDGRLNGNALGYLVFNSKNKVVRDSGKDFGPADAAGRDDKAVKEIIHAELDRLGQRINSRSEMDEKSVGEALGRFSFTTEELKSAFGPNGLQGDERVFFFALVNAHMPDNKVLCRVTGLSENECEQLRGDMRGRFETFMDAAVGELAEMLKKDPKALDSLKVTESEKKLLTNLAALSAKEGRDVTEVAKDKKELQSLETVVANAAMEIDGPGKPGGFWQKLVERSNRPKEKPPEVPVAAKHDEPKKFDETKRHEEPRDRHARHDDEPKKGFADRFPDRGGRDEHTRDRYDREDRHASDRARPHDRDEDSRRPSWSEGRKSAPHDSHASRFRDPDDDGHSMLDRVSRRNEHDERNPHRV